MMDSHAVGLLGSRARDKRFTSEAEAGLRWEIL